MFLVSANNYKDASKKCIQILEFEPENEMMIQYNTALQALCKQQGNLNYFSCYYFWNLLLLKEEVEEDNNMDSEEGNDDDDDDSLDEDENDSSSEASSDRVDDSNDFKN